MHKQIIQCIQDKLKDLEAEAKEDADDINDDAEIERRMKVASITFGYKNGDLIRQLKVRGSLIGAGKYHLVHEVDKNLNNLISEDIKKLKQPVCAFITFTEQDAYERCQKYLFKFDGNGAYNSRY